MDNNPITLMLDEHDVISEAEEVIQMLNQRWVRDPQLYRQSMEKLIDFFKIYSDTYHHHKEEKVLFPELMNNNQFMERGLVEELEQQHDSFRGYLKDTIQALNDDEFERAQNTISTFIDELLVHIGAENDELFIIAEEVFSENELETVFFRFKDIDIELGEARKRDFEQVIPNLKARLIQD